MRSVSANILLCSCVGLVFAVAPVKESPFSLPNDEAGHLLGKVLPPTPLPLSRTDPRHGAKSTAPRLHVNAPVLPLAVVVATPPRLPPFSPRPMLRPESTMEERLGEFLLEIEVPVQPPLPTGSRARVSSEDVSIPPLLPILSRPIADRVPLDDGTHDASRSAAGAAPLPRRTTPVPYTRTSIPQPYENHQPLTTPMPTETLPGP